MAVADVPGIDAFSLVTSGQSFVPSAATEALVTDQQQLLVKTYGAKGQEILEEAQAEADGINAYWKANNIDQPPATVNDVIAVTAFIGSIFGAGGGGEARNSELLGQLQQQLGSGAGSARRGTTSCSPTTRRRRPPSSSAFNYGPLTGGPVTGSVTLDPGSIVSTDVGASAAAAGPRRRRRPRHRRRPRRRRAT